LILVNVCAFKWGMVRQDFETHGSRTREI